MSDEGFEEWDADFLEQLIQVEELALSSCSSTAAPNPSQSLHLPPPNPPLHSHDPPPPTLPPVSRRNPSPAVTYSPPRELSQRPASSFPPSASGAARCVPQLDDKDFEIQRLKRELGCVSKQLSDLKQECSELRKERNKKAEQLNNVSSKNEEKEALVCHSKNPNLDRECEALGVDHPGISRRSQNVTSSTTSSCKAIGVQTDVEGICAKLFSNDDLLTHPDLSKKLLAIWGLPENPMLGRNLVSSLLVACQTDLHVLFGFMGMNFSVKTRMDSPACEKSTSVSQYHLQSGHTLEAVKVSHLYSVLTKINNGMTHLESLLEPLLDLCSLESVVIVHKSLHVLHMFLQHLFSFERNYGESAICSGIILRLKNFALEMVF